MKIQTAEAKEIKNTEVKTGTVIYAFPALGYALVMPAGSTSVAQVMFCRLPYQGGNTGGCVIAAPTPGSLVQYKQQGNTQRGYILTTLSQGTQNSTFCQLNSLCISDKLIQSSKSQMVNQIVSNIKDEQLAIGEKATIAGLQDQQPGDIYMGDRYGPGTFYGRGQIRIKGSDLSYIQLNAFQDRITTVSVKNDLYTLSSQQSKDTELDKYLKASGQFEGLGGIVGKETQVLKIQNKGQKVSYIKPQRHPLYRFQKFSGGAVQGVCCSIIAPITTDKERPSILSYSKDDYDGTSLRLGQGFTSIKTLRVSGISQYPFTQGADQQAVRKETEERKKALNRILQQYKDFKLSDNGIQRILQIALLLYDRDSAGLLLQGIQQSDSKLQYGIDLATESYNKKLKLRDKIPKIGDQQIEDYPNTVVEDKLTNKRVTLFDNSSIISQDPDGSVTIKDGWGSQITMSHGNIYISSALDTFIRPGRDLIALVPRHLSQTANGQIQLAAKQDIKIGAEKNLVMASALNGQPGYTVLQNRSTTGRTSESGMVIRSNGNLSVTASDDIHIGINDKRRVNLGDSGANTGTGSVYIEGNRVRIESNNQLRLSGGLIGVYAYTGSVGAGVEISPFSVTAVGQQVNLDTGIIKMGKSSAQYTIALGTDGKKEVSLLRGADRLSLHVRGELYCQGSIVTGGDLRAIGGISATDYMVFKKKQMKSIPGNQDQNNNYIKSINMIFSDPLEGRTISSDFVQVLQPWYNDDYICKKQLSFFDSWSVKTMPQMSWQVISFYNTNKLLQPIKVAPTGAEQQEYTCAYPGKQAWGNDEEACKMLTVGPDLNVIKADSNKAPLLKNAYKTNTER